MGPRRLVALAFLVVVVSGAIASGVATGGATGEAPDDGPPVEAHDDWNGNSGVGGNPEPALDRPDPAVVIRINLTADGDARWTIASRFDLDNGTKRAAFEALVADVRNGSPPASAVGYSTDTFRRFASRVERSVNRSTEMRIESSEWNGRVDDDVGVLSLSFTWTNFARSSGRQVVLGDVFRVEEEWFSTVEPDQRLVISAPPGYAVTDYELTRPIDNGTVYIDGPANLTALDVSIVYTPIGIRTPTDTATPTDGTTDPPTVTPNGPRQGFDLLTIGGGLLFLLVIVALAAYVVSTGSFGGREREQPESEPRPEAEASPDAETSGEDAAGTDAADGTEAEPEPGSEPAVTDERAGPTAVDDAGKAIGEAESEPEPVQDQDGDESETEGIDEELLSDEERVERLLERNGGRMKQANIVSETGWSNAKVSQLLSAMDEEDRIDKLRIGRENLISLPDEDVGEFE